MELCDHVWNEVSDVLWCCECGVLKTRDDVYYLPKTQDGDKILNVNKYISMTYEENDIVIEVMDNDYYHYGSVPFEKLRRWLNKL